MVTAQIKLQKAKQGANSLQMYQAEEEEDMLQNMSPFSFCSSSSFIAECFIIAN